MFQEGNVTSSPEVLAGPVLPAYPSPGPPSLWAKVRDVCNIILILAGASYGLHYIYQVRLCLYSSIA